MLRPYEYIRQNEMHLNRSLLIPKLTNLVLAGLAFLIANIKLVCSEEYNINLMSRCTYLDPPRIPTPPSPPKGEGGL